MGLKLHRELQLGSDPIPWKSQPKGKEDVVSQLEKGRRVYPVVLPSEHGKHPKIAPG